MMLLNSRLNTAKSVSVLYLTLQGQKVKTREWIFSGAENIFTRRCISRVDFWSRDCHYHIVFPVVFFILLSSHLIISGFWSKSLSLPSILHYFLIPRRQLFPPVSHFLPKVFLRSLCSWIRSRDPRWYPRKGLCKSFIIKKSDCNVRVRNTQRS